MCTYFELHYTCGHAIGSHRCAFPTTPIGDCGNKVRLHGNRDDACVECKLTRGESRWEVMEGLDARREIGENVSRGAGDFLGSRDAGLDVETRLRAGLERERWREHEEGGASGSRGMGGDEVGRMNKSSDVVPRGASSRKLALKPAPIKLFSEPVLKGTSESLDAYTRPERGQMDMGTETEGCDASSPSPSLVVRLPVRVSADLLPSHNVPNFKDVQEGHEQDANFEGGILKGKAYSSPRRKQTGTIHFREQNGLSNGITVLETLPNPLSLIVRLRLRSDSAMSNNASGDSVTKRKFSEIDSAEEYRQWHDLPLGQVCSILAHK